VFKGISGSSAGAINSFLLSLGMTSDEIDFELGRPDWLEAYKSAGDKGSLPNSTVYTQFGLSRSTSKFKPISRAEKFMSPPNMDNIICVMEKYKSNNATSYIRPTPINTLSSKITMPNLFRFIVPIIKWFRLSHNIDSLFLNILLSSIDQGRGTEYLFSALCHRGLFSGYETVEFFEEMFIKYLKPKIVDPNNKMFENYESYINVNQPPRNITFKEYYAVTGIDLVVTGTNISQGKPKYFSVYHTPDFPVILAVCISMTFPVVFKPKYVEFQVNKALDKFDDYNLGYKGMYVDGGMLNNLPFHAFDKIVTLEAIKGFSKDLKEINLVKYRLDFSTINEIKIASSLPFGPEPLNEKVLGIRCDKPSTIRETAAKINEDMLNAKAKNIVDLLGNMVDTFMYPGESGQIRTNKEKEQTIELPTRRYAGAMTEDELKKEIEDTVKGLKKEDKSPNAKRIKKLEEISLDLIDFAVGITDDFRGNAKLAKAKKLLIEEAYKVTSARLNALK
jgi:predicted acylesterase/phospholipase RssA